METSQMAAIGAMVISVIGGVVLAAASVWSANKRIRRLTDKGKRLNKMRVDLAQKPEGLEVLSGVE